jgi:hypothetical protein
MSAIDSVLDGWYKGAPLRSGKASETTSQERSDGSYISFRDPVTLTVVRGGPYVKNTMMSQRFIHHSAKLTTVV